MHEYDQNFSQHVLLQIGEFLDNPDVLARPHEYASLVREMKLEAILVTENSPYAEVRAVVENTDNVDMPSFTFRTWIIGLIFSGIGAAINQLFSLRQPPITITSEVAQLLAWPVGKILEAVLPDKGFYIRGKRHSINPGPFNKKEHMLITIMATVAFNTPYTTDIIVSQYLPQYFNQSYAADFGYQILGGLGTNLCGYGLAGLARRFLIYPSYTVWPASLVTIALNRALHDSADQNHAIRGPFNRMYSWTRMRFFTIMFLAMFVYFWFPGYIFTALSTFNWISWIAPNHMALNNIVGSVNGLGFNPWPTFDFNTICSWIQSSYNPLVFPAYTTFNIAGGMLIASFFTIGFYWTNTWNTSYLPINSNHIWDNTGNPYNVSRAIDERGIFDFDKYQQYSQPWLAAGNLSSESHYLRSFTDHLPLDYFWFFAQYTSAFGYAVIFHRREMAQGFKGFWKSVKRLGRHDVTIEDDLTEDIHARLMKSYPEVPEWWYLTVLLIAMGVGMAGVGA